MDRNRILLQDLWFYDRVDEYDQLDASQRAEFLDRQLHTAIQWQALELSDPSEVETSSGASPISRVITHWIDSAKDEEAQQRVVAVLGAAAVRWLSTHEVETLSVQARRSFATELFDQVQREGVAPVLAESLTVSGEPSESDRLLRNGELLLEAWFFEQARIYHSLGSNEQRQHFIRDKVATVRQSPLLTMLTSNGNARTNPLVQVPRILQMIQGWIERADESDRRMLQEFSNAVYQEVIAGFMRS